MRKLTTSRGSYEELVSVEFGLYTAKNISCCTAANILSVVVVLNDAASHGC